MDSFGTWQQAELQEQDRDEQDRDEGLEQERDLDLYDQDQEQDQKQDQEQQEDQQKDQDQEVSVSMTHAERVYRTVERSPVPLRASTIIEETGGFTSPSNGYSIIRSLETKGLLKSKADAGGTRFFSKGLNWDAVSHKRGRKPGKPGQVQKVAAKRNTAKPVATAQRSTVGTPTITGVAIVVNQDGSHLYWQTEGGKTYRVEEVENIFI